MGIPTARLRPAMRLINGFGVRSTRHRGVVLHKHRCRHGCQGKINAKMHHQQQQHGDGRDGRGGSSKSSSSPTSSNVRGHNWSNITGSSRSKCAHDKPRVQPSRCQVHFQTSVDPQYGFDAHESGDITAPGGSSRRLQLPKRACLSWHHSAETLGPTWHQHSISSISIGTGVYMRRQC